MYLEQLPHQSDAIKAIMDAMNGCRDNVQDNDNPYANHNINIQQNIDVKMETATGKTYVYTRMMYEMFKQYGLNKFIIFVPSLAIKEGTKAFITHKDTKQHFSGLYENIHIDLDMINAGDFNTKKGRKTIPAALMDFLEGTRNDSKTIKCLLLNDDMLISKSMTRDDYDQTLINSYSCPIDSIKAVKPVVIIDEPHRFAKTTKAWQAIQGLEPQLIVRFGATFPKITVGSGRNKVEKDDFEDLVYDLNAVNAFNNGLVKGINVIFPEINQAQAARKYRVTSVTNRSLTLTESGNRYEMAIGDALPSEFEGGITFDGNKMLSTGLELSDGMILIPSLFSSSYQELLIKQAIESHFKKERENWFRENCGMNPAKIKTLTLFFIDNIASYRNEDGWLKQTFERLLRAKLRELIGLEKNQEYKDFLEQSLANIAETHGGYFAEDRATAKDDGIQAEVNDILRNRDKLTSFKDEKGNWVLRRFLFSKWTLREGWDNTNVFTIAKLRTSGSESSKIQEVGRGLRLPVDENHKRISTQEFRLDFLIDWSEKDFADKLINEINSDGGIVQNMKININILEALVANGYADSVDRAKGGLLFAGVINASDDIVDVDGLIKLLPDNYSLRKGVVTVNSEKKPVVKLRKENWEKLKDVWQEVTKRYMVVYDKISDEDLNSILKHALLESFTPSEGQITTYSLESQDGKIVSKATTKHISTPLIRLSYGKFMRRLSERTLIPVNTWHKAMCELYGCGMVPDRINDGSLDNVLKRFHEKFLSTFMQKFNYQSLDFSANTTLIKDGNFVDEITQGLVGTHEATDLMVEPNYLYDKKVYDTSIEREVLKLTPDNKVNVFGKLPRKCIKIPTYVGGTTSPDFVYAVTNGNNIKLTLFVETKSDNLRDTDIIALNAQEKLFDKIENVKWKKVTRASEVTTEIQKLLN